MAGRRQQAAFRPAATPVSASAPSRRQAIVLISVLALIVAGITVASFAVKPSTARAFDLFYGSMFVDDDTAPVAIDLASGKPTVRLPGAYQQVNAKQPGDLDVVPLSGGTLLLDTVSGEFNMVDSTGLVAKSGGGVSVGPAAQTTTSLGLASGGSAYIVRTGASSTSVYLVTLRTVTSAIGGGPTRPRASVGLTEPVKDPATSTVTANGRLWLLAGAGGSRTIQELSVPNGSNPGATLNVADHGQVNGVAAIGVSTARADGLGADDVAVASSDSIALFDSSGQSRRVAVQAPPGVDSILPITNQEGGFAFLYHSPSGWSVVRAAVAGGRGAVVQPLTGVDRAAPLAEPAQSNGALYTADRSSGALWQIDAAGRATAVPDVATYPLIAGETADFSLIKISARGARVIFNARNKLEAVTVFTDGSHKPIINDKRTAVDLTANGAAAALTDLHHQPNPTNAPPKTKVDPAQQVTDKIDCSTVKQTPHIPTVELVGSAARSVQLSWTYPLLDRQDCAPSTYTVTIKLLSDNAPAAPHLPAIQGSTGVNVTGLFPDTQYSVVVTAYINGQGTPSAPLPVRTTVEGPAAPTGLQASADDQGNWTLGWNSCGGVQNSCVPAANWTVIAQVCDGEGLVSAPANLQVVGDPTSHSFSAQYKGSPALLGHGLSFQVVGVGEKGTGGTASASSACTYSWAHPIPGNIYVAASSPPATTVQGTTKTEVTVSFTGDKDVALGGAGGQLTYQLMSEGARVGDPVGPTSNTSASLPGILPGQEYQVRVTVSPPRQPTASVALPLKSVDAAVANWPTLTLSPTFERSGSSKGTLSIRIDGLTSAQARGEQFDLTDSSQLVCGNTVLPLSGSNFDPAKALSFPIDRSQYNGGCSVTVQLVENPGSKSPQYFGGAPSSAASGDVNIPVPELDTNAGMFRANFSGGGILQTPVAVVSLPGGSDLLSQYAQGWSSQVQYQDSGGSWIDCGSAATTNLAKAAASVDLTSCYYGHRSASYQVLVSFTYFGQTPNPAYPVPVSGSGPAPVDPTSISFSAGWFGSDLALEAAGYDQSTLDQLQWAITVSTSTGKPCGTDNQVSVSHYRAIGGVLDNCPALTGVVSTGPSQSPGVPTVYVITVTFTDPYGTKGSYKTPTDFIIHGNPPQ